MNEVGFDGKVESTLTISGLVHIHLPKDQGVSIVDRQLLKSQGRQPV
jgi:hypothetical protein